MPERGGMRGMSIAAALLSLALSYGGALRAADADGESARPPRLEELVETLDEIRLDVGGIETPASAVSAGGTPLRPPTGAKGESASGGAQLRPPTANAAAEARTSPKPPSETDEKLIRLGIVTDESASGPAAHPAASQPNTIVIQRGRPQDRDADALLPPPRAPETRRADPLRSAAGEPLRSAPPMRPGRSTTKDTAEPGEGSVRVTLRPADAWHSTFAAPLRYEAFSRDGGELKVIARGGGWICNRTIALEPGVPVAIEQPYFGNLRGTLSWTLGGEADSRSFSWQTYSDRDSPPVMCLNGHLYREFDTMVAARARGVKRTVGIIQGSALPSQWQSYLGLRCILVCGPDDIASLSPAQRNALSIWIRWLGGTLYMSEEDEEAARVLERVGLPLAAASVEDSGGMTTATYLNGDVVLFPTERIGALPLETAAGEDLLASYRESGYSAFARTLRERLLKKLGETPVAFIIVSLLALGFLLGPVLCLFVFRRGKPLAFFVLTPVVALLGTLGIVGGAFFMEGIGVKYNEHAVLARHAGGNNAILFDLRGVRPGFSPPPLKFPDETLLLPLERSHGDEFVVDMTDGQSPGAGWMRPRAASGILSAKPLICRMNVEVHPDGAGYKAVNNLGHTVTRMATVLPDGNIGWAENVEPGASKKLEPERGTRRYEALCEDAAGLFDKAAPFGNVLLVAEADGLPYLDDGGLGGRLLDGRFFYIVAGNRTAHGEEGGALNGR